MMNESYFPAGFIGQLAPLLGTSLPDFLHSYEEEPLRGLRMRPGMLPPNEAQGQIPWAENAWYLPLDSTLGSHPLHEAGAYYLQEPSAMLAAAALRPAPGDRVLDLCAAPGGKSTQLAAYMQGQGALVCNEPVFSRAQVLSRNIERMGVPNAVVISALPEELSPRWPEWFDKILVDAPCSGEGMFRRHPETMAQWNAASPAGCAQRQEQILRHAARMLRPGGYLAYSTCTFNPTENEGVIEAFLSDHPDFSLVPFSLPGLGSCDGRMRLWPHLQKGEGHFAALMQKKSDAPAKKRAQTDFAAPDKVSVEVAQAFLREQFDDVPAPQLIFAGKLVQPPRDIPPLKGIKTLRLGLHLGEVRGKVFQPDHALALTLPGRQIIEATESAAREYQAGNPLPAPDDLRGWSILRLGECQLGWVKSSDGWMKNHYPKGLRKSY